ncbi:MAG TPA: tetratricopeptide repeat protein [Gemmataceae bacterium]
MSRPLLARLFEDLPRPAPLDDPEDWAPRVRQALRRFRERAEAHYTEGTLQRLLTSPDVTARRAAVLALGLCGTMASNRDLAGRLHDPDEEVRRMAGDALRELWARGNNERQARRLRRLARRAGPEQVLAELNALITDEPDFAEAINQRAIVYFQRGEYTRAVADCRRVLELNPYHFGAQAGMGRCFLKLRKYRAALRAFEAALGINPTLTDLTETVRALRRELGGE